MGTIGNSYSPLKLDESVLNTKLNKIASENLDMNGFDITGVNTINGGLMDGFRNKVINGNFDFWNQATSQTTNGYGSADIWFNNHSGSTKTTSRQAFSIGQTDVPGNPTYYCRTVVSSVAGASNSVSLRHRVENVSHLSGKTVTLTFYAKADSAKDIAILIGQNFGTGGSPSSYVNVDVNTITLSTAFQKFTYTIDIPSVSGKTLGTDDNDYLEVVFWFDAGSSVDAFTNSLGQQSGTFDIARVSLVEGDATNEDDPFPAYDISIEALRVKRYFEICHSFGFSYFNAVTANALDQFSVGMTYAVPKRATPTLTTISSGSGTYAVIYNTATRVAHRVTINFSTYLDITFSVDARL